MTVRRARAKRSQERNLYGGIDPGKQGFFVVYDGIEIIDAQPMPLMANEYDRRAILSLLEDWVDQGVKFVVVEKQAPFARDTPTTAFAVGRGYGNLEMALIATRLSFEIWKPDAWKRTLKIPAPNKKVKGAQRSRAIKGLSERKARELAPYADFRKTERSRVAHSGKVEAFLMAFLAHRLKEGA